MSRLITLSALIAVGALTVLVQAQADPAAIRLEKVKDNLYVVTGGRQGGGIAGNTTVYVADAGVVLIDTKYSGLATRFSNR